MAPQSLKPYMLRCFSQAVSSYTSSRSPCYSAYCIVRYHSRGVHTTAKNGYTGETIDLYEAGRPTYSSESVSYLLDKLRVDQRSQAKRYYLVDVGCGTGKFTREVVKRLPAEHQEKILGIEPVDAMRRKFGDILPGVPTLKGTAENTLLPDECTRAIVSAQAFHWFATPLTLVEFHRILAPEGRVGLVWNTRDRSVGGWVEDLERLIDRLYPEDVPRQQTDQWRACFSTPPTRSLFGALHAWSGTLTQTGDVALITHRVMSLSVVGALPAQEQAQVASEVKELLATHPQTRGLTQLTLPYRTDVFWCTKK